MRRFLKWLAIVIGVLLWSVVAFGSGLVAGNANLLTPCIVGTASEPKQFGLFWDVWNLVQKDFIDRAALDPTKMTYGAIQGMVESLGDTGHTTFLTPDENKQREESMSGTFTGIGAELDQHNGVPVIVVTFDGSPAQKAGVKAGDIIMKVDGVDVSTMTLSQITEKIRGPADSKVTLDLFRLAEKQTLQITITRGKITVPAVSSAMIPGTRIGLIRISQFSDEADVGVLKAISETRKSGATGVIVDVRSNPGGLLDQAIKVTSQFLKDGNVLLEEDAQGNRVPFPVQPGGQMTDLPLVVLVNAATASSSEIFAGAIQDHQRGQVVGETTFGTGTVLQPIALPDGSELLLGTRQWLTPNGRLIRKQGIKPDVEVKLSLGTDLLLPDTIQGLTLTQIITGTDTQMSKALELLGVTK